VRRRTVLFIAVPVVLVGAGAAAVYVASRPARVDPSAVLDEGGASGGNLDEGAALFEARSLDEAEAYFQSVLDQYPGEIGAIVYLGRIAIERGDGAQAAALLEQAVEAEPDNADHHYWLGTAYGVQAMQGNPLQAFALAKRVKGEYLRAVELDPDHLLARQGLMMVYAMTPEFAGGSMEKAKAQADEIARIDECEGLSAEAVIAWREQRQDDRLRLLEQAVEQCPDRPAPYIMLMRAQEEQGQIDEAFATCDALLALEPDGSVGLYQLGRLAATTGQPLDEGEAALREHLALDPPPSALGRPIPPEYAHLRLGQIYVHKGDTDAARAEFAHALEIDPDLAEARAAMTELE